MQKSETLDPHAPAAAQSPVAERILGAAFQAFMQDGYAGASTLEIATRAKVSKRELYAHFGSKQAILRACIATRARRMRPPEPPPTPHSAEALEIALAAFGVRLLEEVLHPVVVAVHRLAVVEAARAPEIGQELESVRRQTRDGVAELIGRAQQAGLTGAGEPQEMAREFLALLFGDLMVRLMQRVIEQPDAAVAQARARRAARAFLRLHGAGA